MTAPSEPRDLITKLQLQLSDLCKSYFTALGHLQNEVERAAQQPPQSECATPALTATLADDIVRGHRQFGELVDALERTQRTEAEQEARLRELQQEDAELTDQIRAEAAKAAETRQGLREEISDLMAAIEEAELPAKNRADG